MNTSKSILPIQFEETNKEQVDQEWFQLLMIAKSIGITPNEIRNFFSQTSNRDKFTFNIKKHNIK